jgi:5-formyltetrahydrofolate cyclo-ligase
MIAAKKKLLRQQAIAFRRAINVAVWQKKNQDLCDRLALWQKFQQAQVILAYQSFRQEPDLSHLWQRFPDKTWGFPRCVGKDLSWHQVPVAEFDPQGSSLLVGEFGILEPHPDLPLIDLNAIDLILIPAVACDRSGYRLGYGGGFYDRWLSDRHGAKAYRAGIVFSDFFWESLPHEAWDIPIETICTELGIFEVRSQQTN